MCKHCILATIIVIGIVSGIHGAPPKITEPDAPGIVFIVGGVGGLDLLPSAARRAVPKVNGPREIRNFVWTHGKGHFFRDLQDFRYAERKAEELACELRAARLEDPTRPIYLVAKSGGTGLALLAAGQLTPGTLERIILLSAAVSPTYDLRPALRATRGRIVSFYSKRDWLILGWGTNYFGTIDRYYSASAGFGGFVIPQDLSEEDRKLHDKLVQVAWRPDMILEGNWGTHVGTSMPGFVEKEVAPWLKP